MKNCNLYVYNKTIKGSFSWNEIEKIKLHFLNIELGEVWFFVMSIENKVAYEKY